MEDLDTFELPPLLPLEVRGGIHAHAEVMEERARREPAEAHRLTQIAFVLREAGTQIRATRWTVDAPGRIYLHDDPLQGIPKSVRHLLGAPRGCVFVAADWKGAHLAIAKAWTGDELTSYDWLAASLGVPRKAAKIAALAFINGAGADRIQRITGKDDAYAKLRQLLPGVVDLWRQAFDIHTEPGATFKVHTLSGRRVEVPKATHAGGWRRMLSALWTATEAEAMKRVLLHLPATLVMPLFDGLVVCCAEDKVERVAVEMDTLMKESASASGVELDAEVGWGSTWAEAEGIDIVPLPEVR